MFETLLYICSEWFISWEFHVLQAQVMFWFLHVYVPTEEPLLRGHFQLCMTPPPPTKLLKKSPKIYFTLIRCENAVRQNFLVIDLYFWSTFWKTTSLQLDWFNQKFRPGSWTLVVEIFCGLIWDFLCVLEGHCVGERLQKVCGSGLVLHMKTFGAGSQHCCFEYLLKLSSWKQF